MASKVVCLATLLLFSHCVTSLIIPEELPTILSLIYSNIPPIKKGTDSRLGVGFRLGEHADVQFIVELGPQTNTDPIGNDPDSKRKRAATLTAAIRGELGPWAQTVAKYQMEQKIKKLLEKYKLPYDKPLKLKDDSIKKINDKNPPNDWLSKWSQGLGVNQDVPTETENVSSLKRLPHVNRMKVVNSPTDIDDQKNDNGQKDLEILKKLFGQNSNDTASAQ